MWGHVLRPAMLVIMTAFLARSAEAATCTRAVVIGGRPTGSTEFSLRATQDSALDDRLPAPQHDRLRNRYPEETTARYGQVFELLHVRGADAPLLSGAQRAVVRWWRLGLQCQHSAQVEALRPNIRDMFVAARMNGDPDLANTAILRPRTQWINGLPTLDIIEDVPFYAPDPAKSPVGSRWMKMAEYREFYALRSWTTATWQESEAAYARLMAWVAANPALAALAPAPTEICVARGLASAGMRVPHVRC